MSIKGKYQIERKYKGRITAPIPYLVYERIDGWVDIGQSSWIPEEHLLIETQI